MTIEQAGRPLESLSIIVPSLDTSVTINLICRYAAHSSFEWTMFDITGQTLETGNDFEVTKRFRSAAFRSESSLTYTLTNSNTSLWQDFFRVGLRVRCNASTTRSPLNNTNFKEIKVEGIRTINHGEKQFFFCSSYTFERFTWKVDGKVLEGPNGANATIPFYVDRPRRYFVECEDLKGSNLAQYSMIVCGYDKFQHNMLFIAMCLTPAFFVVLFLFNILLPIFQSKKRENEIVVNENDLENISNFFQIQLFILPIYSSFSYLLDVVTDYMAFLSYVVAGNPNFGLATLALILFSSLVTSSIAATNVLFSDDKTKPVFERLTKTSFRRALTYIFMFCNFGPILIQIHLFLLNLDILRLTRAKKEVTHDLKRKRGQTLKLLMKLAISELICESLGQGILQAFILSKQLGTEEICLPDNFHAPQRPTESPTTSSSSVLVGMFWGRSVDSFRDPYPDYSPFLLRESWVNGEHDFQSYTTEGQILSSTGKCQCNFWLAKGAEHCYPGEYLQGHQREAIFKNLNCFIADCSTSKRKWSIIFPFVQVVSSIFQISFAMTHLGAVNNLSHLVSLKAAVKKAFFFILTLFYFLLSLTVALLLSTYLTNVYGDGFYQLMAFLSVLRLILPDATPARRYLPPWLKRFLTVFLPLVAHLPFYIILYLKFSQDANDCDEQVKNRITIHLRQDQTFGRNIAAFYATAPEVENSLIQQLTNMDLFPINLRGLTDDKSRKFKLPSDDNDPVLNIRNNFNVFGHFFLWTGYLCLVDIVMTGIFLAYWVFVVRPHQTVPTVNRLVELMRKSNLHSVDPDARENIELDVSVISAATLAPAFFAPASLELD